MKGNFQIITLIIFIVAAVFGVLVFSGAIPLGNKGASGASGTVTLWGTVRESAIAAALDEFNLANSDFAVKYVEKSPNTFNQDLLEALASGQGPDMFFLSDDLVFGYKNKIIPIPYSNFSVASYKKTFVGAGDVFLTSKGILAVPIAIDPLMMYYNRGILEAKGVIYPPEYWDQFEDLVPTLTEKDDNQRILKSAVALGQFSNIAHAKDIITTLFMQIGNPIVMAEDGAFVSALGANNGKYSSSSVLEFYTSFANPLKSVYSWNRSFSNSSSAFSSNDLVFYFGYASEFLPLVAKNPNQNFFVSPMPQVRGETFKLTSARVTGIAVSSSTKNLNTAFYVANLMANGDFAAKFASALGVAPVRKDLLAKPPADTYSPTFYASSIYARSWLDPSPKDTDDIFRSLVEKVSSNALSPDEAIKDADSKLWLLLGR
ncbi:MAG: ABC transporter substrate-binding protein [bacterium]|nr:ABC transporter substrate-binding protein [bacterium]